MSFLVGIHVLNDVEDGLALSWAWPYLRSGKRMTCRPYSSICTSETSLSSMGGTLPSSSSENITNTKAYQSWTTLYIVILRWNKILQCFCALVQATCFLLPTPAKETAPITSTSIFQHKCETQYFIGLRSSFSEEVLLSLV
jgi:hypothetical protein